MTGPVVLEGPDGGGKSTLAAALVEARALLAPDVPTALHKNVAPSPGTDGRALFREYAGQLAEGAIVDRSWPSEMIYGRRYRGGSLLEPIDAGRLAGTLRAMGGLLVICLPPVEACARAWRERKGAGDDPKAEEELRAIWKEYERVASMSLARTIRHDWTRPNAHAAMVNRLLGPIS